MLWQSNFFRDITTPCPQ
ncbi:hypothetical protein Ahy_Scaffold1g106664 isoform C [Arachis hypogaea]|uniref:Uncharacterized protein n=1 Tax=Arachis hypogaea TaxID=3818 RepID=A0A444WR60_ARAHY|nr:hypothetical protein Ahy_Scaffold1g106664 isoform C [Arachis hypogaea]